MYKYVVSSHMNPVLSGVAKFNLNLSQLLRTDCVSFSEAKTSLNSNDKLLLSVKIIDINDEEKKDIIQTLKIAKQKGVKIFTFFHTFNELPLEYDILAQSEEIFCGNLEIKHSLLGFNKPITDLWCPYLVDLSTSLEQRKFNIFTFGMAHKLQLKHYQLLFDKLSKTGLDYSIWVSTAFHEKANFGDFHDISKQLISIFDRKIQFLGFLSDEAINYFIDQVQLFVSFFPRGVRANNTSIYVPMERNCPVITNLDEYSPSWFMHGKNILDINYLKNEHFEKDFLKKISQKAKRDVGHHISWEALVERIQR